MESINFSNGGDVVTQLGWSIGIRASKATRTKQNHVVLDRTRRSVLRVGRKRDAVKNAAPSKPSVKLNKF